MPLLYWDIHVTKECHILNSSHSMKWRENITLSFYSLRRHCIFWASLLACNEETSLAYLSTSQSPLAQVFN